MADVAVLGISVESSQVKSATSDLNKLTVASNSAEAAQQRIKTASGQVGVTFKTVQTMADRAGVSFDEMKKGIEANMAAQGKMAASSAPAVKGMQQLSEKAGNAANDNDKLSKKTDQATSSMEKFATRLTRGLIAGVAVAGVRDLLQYLTQLNTQLAATYTTANRAGIGSGQFQGLQTVAAINGVNNQDFNSGMLAFNQQIALAKNGIGEMQTLLKSNGQTVGDTATTFGKVADLIQRARGDYAKQVSILQQAGLPATQQWVSLMEQGSAAINKQADASSKVTAQQLEHQKQINDGWNKIVEEFQQSMKEFVVSASEFPRVGSPLADFIAMVSGQKKWSITLDLSPEPGSTLDWLIKNWVKLGVKAGIVAPTADLVANPANPTPSVTRGADLSAPKTLAPVFDPQKDALIAQRTNAILAQLGQLATVEQQVTMRENELRIARDQGNGVSKTQYDMIVNATRAQAEQAQVQAKAQVGLFNFAEAQRAVNDNLQTLVDRKLLDPNNPAQYAAATTAAAKSIENLANQAKVAGAPLEQLQRLANDAGSARTQLDQFSTTTLNGLSDGFVSVLNHSSSAGDAVKNFTLTAITALEKLAVQMLIIAPIAKSLQGLFGGSLSFLGLGFSDGGYVNPGNSSNPLPGLTAADYGAGFATGGYTGSGGKYAPAGIVHRGEYVFDAASTSRIGVGNLERLRRTLPGFADGGYAGNVVAMPGKGQDNQPIVFNYSPNIDARGADAQAVARLATAQANDRKNFENNVKAVMVRYRSNTPGA
jgi:lambda family phage tail tape measure protein